MKRSVRQLAACTGLVLMMTACSSNAAGGGSSAASAQSAASALASQAQSAASAVSEAVSAVSADALFEAIGAAVTLPDMANIDPAFNYGISTDLCDSYVFYRTKEVTQADTIAIFAVSDAANVDQIRQELEQAKSFDIDSADGYNPDTFEMFSASEIKTAGNLVYWIVSSDAAAIEQILTSAQ